MPGHQGYNTLESFLVRTVYILISTAVHNSDPGWRQKSMREHRPKLLNDVL